MIIHPTHTCFDDALDWIESEVKRVGAADFRPSEYRVVHAICLKPDGERYAHAWVEHGDEAIGCGLLNGGLKAYYFADRRDFYRHFRPQELIRYTLFEVVKNNTRTNSYGPWEPYYRTLCNR